MTKHTILFLAADPNGTDPRALDREARAIQVELERSGFRDHFELETRWAAEPLDLLRELRKLRPTVVHFAGRGTAEAALRFQGPDGRPQLVSTEALEETFGAAGSSIQLVVLSACYSDMQARALLPHVGCVIGMNGALHAAAARNFAIGFYGGLGARESVAAAYKQGCAAIRLEGHDDRHRPQLLVRADVDAGTLVLAAGPTEPPVPGRPAPAYPDVATRARSEWLEDARERRRRLRDAGLATDDLDREIVAVRRQLREGGRLRAGDALDDGRYLLVQEVGRGGFAVVWDAYDGTEQHHVAIKVLHANLAGDRLRRERFLRGARTMRALAHPAVVRVLEGEGEDGGFHYFVMELLTGGNLRQVVLAKGVANERALPLLLRVIEAVAMAHARGMIHRDIKPANILLDGEGNPKLTDFDLVGAADTTGGTRTGAMGTVIYAAPECLEKPQEATARADVYGLGMTALFCLSGQELSLSVFRNPEPLIARLACSERVREVLRRAVAWEPGHRFADAAALGHALRQALSPPRRERGGAEILVTWRGLGPIAGGAGPVSALVAKPPARPEEPAASRLPIAAAVGLTPPVALVPRGPEGGAAKPTSEAAAGQSASRPAKLSEDAVVSSPPRPSVPPAGAPATPPASPPVRAQAGAGLRPAGAPVAEAPASSVPASLEAPTQVWREPVRRWAVRAGVAAFTLGVVAYITFRDAASPDAAIDAPKQVAVGSQPDAAVDGGSQPDAAAPKNCPEGMVPVAAGTFQMGSPNGQGADDEHPQHPVTLSGYCIDRTEVTVAAYETCVAAKGCSAAPRTVKWSELSEEETKQGSQYCNGNDRLDHPMNCVDWGEATAYCKWADKRLPTEAEWEYAARHDPKSNKDYDYPWGNEAPSTKRLNACGSECVAMVKRDQKEDWKAMYDSSDGWEPTAPVGRFLAGASPVGALDMAGNVWEWTADRYGDDAATAETNPQGAKTRTERVLRGGGWIDRDVAGVRAAFRGRLDPTVRIVHVGFRCAHGD